jgi:tRNA modification GTPase
MGGTIFALASGTGRAGLAVWRLSGPLAGAALRALTGRALPVPRRATRARLRDGLGEDLDDGLVLWFPAPASFTGEDVAELHLHGGRAVAQALSAALAELGLRPAGPGEFSRRAFAHGKLDLTRAEAIADLVAAETAAQRRQALRQLDGGLETLVEGWRSRLIGLLALLEAAIDFTDQDLPDGLDLRLRSEAADLSALLAAHLDDRQRGERLRDGVHVALLGAPNAGKSSLLNRLAGREAAIVSAQAGTTRDVIEIHLDLGGWPLVVADTAGLREADGEVEAEGVRRALDRARSVDLRLCVFDAMRLPDLDSATRSMIDDATLVLLNKIDQCPAPLPQTIDGRPVLGVSAKSGAGLDDLLARLGMIVEGNQGAGPPPVLTRARHRAAIDECRAALDRFALARDPGLAAEELRAAALALGRITGRVELDEVLDRIFAEFCIGK